MSYDKQAWADGPTGATPITAVRLGHIEDGIEAAAATADTAQAGLASKASSADVTALGSRVTTAEADLTGRLSASALGAASVAAVEDAATVAPTGAWDFAQTPTVGGVPVGSGGSIDADDITDATVTGKALVRAATAAAARTAIGAGTSSLAIGTTASTAKAGNYAPSTASTTAQGIVELATTAETTTGTDTARAVTPAGVKAVADTKTAVTVDGVPTPTLDIDSTPVTLVTLGGMAAVVWNGSAWPASRPTGVSVYVLGGAAAPSWLTASDVWDHS